MSETAEGQGLTRTQLAVLAVTAGVSVANLYYLQPLLALVGRDLGASLRELGLVSMLTQLGYAAGLFLFVPLGDALERRGLMLWLLGAVTVSLCACAAAPSVPVLAGASFAVGCTTVVPQIAVPLAAHLARPQERGRVVGAVMGGLLVGILLARTASGVLGAHLGWRAVYLAAAAVMVLLALSLRALLPRSRPAEPVRYGALLASLPRLVRDEPVLREAAALGALGFAAFSAFWTTLVFLLEERFGLGSQAAGLFGLVGVAGALGATVTGRFADRLPRRRIAGLGLVITLAAFAVFAVPAFALAGLVAGVLLLDLGVQVNHVANLSRVHALRSEARSRLNMLYMVTYFAGGASGTGLGAFAWARFGWTGVCAAGAALCATGLGALAARRGAGPT
ncbi:MFS transporter [Anaeromyxobacter paludicola]|uniref:MFS transporter n=1 Tax=Anaeromyxobacter paludicola TaxID=2918171 RepID=A0ABM7XDL8_9BACT|nr:MFS transporter [Anaeromyxobacter paludicola]BDG09962.1 MFS transporter [Anaeromyxobacter paludicola]